MEEELSQIFDRLAHALVEATPEWWSVAELELIASADRPGEGLAHSIRSAMYPHDIVVPTDEVFEATRALELAGVRHGDVWHRCVFRVVQEPTGAWLFTAKFDRDA